MEKVEKTSNVARNVARVAGHVPGHVRREWATFVNCPRPCCWPRFWPRSSQCGHVLATFVATFRSCSTWPEHGPQHGRARWPRYNVTNEPVRRSCFGHVRGHVPATFVATFRSRSWPRSNMIFEVFSRVFLEVFKIGQMRLVNGSRSRTPQNATKFNF